MRRSSTNQGETRASVALVYRLAALMRASFIYPVNNQRVIEARDEFLSHSQAWISGGAYLSVQLRNGDIELNGLPVNAPTQLAGWIRDCFEQALVSGVEVAPDIDINAIEEFATVLRRCEEESDLDYESLWGGDFFGMIPMPFPDAAESESDSKSAPQAPSSLQEQVASRSESDAEPAQFKATSPLGFGGTKPSEEDRGLAHGITPQGPPKCDEDLAALIEQIQRLPTSAMLGLVADDTRQESELFGVYLHRYRKEPNEQTAERLGKRILAMLESPSPGMLKVLEPYLESVPEEAEPATAEERSMVMFLQQNGRADLLRKNEYLRPDVIAFSFPENFTLFLDSLSPSRPRDQKALRDVCFAIKPERLEAATEALISEEGILTPSRVEMIAAVGTYEVLPMISIIAAHGPAWSRTPVTQYLRKQEFPAAEAAALRAINPPSLIPSGYLRDLCELKSVFHGNPKLREFSGFLVRKFIEDSASHPEQAERRIYAIRSLRYLPSLESIKLLKKLSTATKLLRLSKAARAERQAALETLQEMVGD
ncbi:MAG: hypothetical protein ACYTG5_06160 [Planctomycetota bacterium]